MKYYGGLSRLSANFRSKMDSSLSAMYLIIVRHAYIVTLLLGAVRTKIE
jgi:hypothetical protein